MTERLIEGENGVDLGARHQMKESLVGHTERRLHVHALRARRERRRARVECSGVRDEIVRTLAAEGEIVRVASREAAVKRDLGADAGACNRGGAIDAAHARLKRHARVVTILGNDGHARAHIKIRASARVVVVRAQMALGRPARSACVGWARWYTLGVRVVSASYLRCVTGSHEASSSGRMSHVRLDNGSRRAPWGNLYGRQ